MGWRAAHACIADRERASRGSRERSSQLSNTLYPHSAGHHLGLNVHDTPTVSKMSRLADGHVVTIEPGVYVPNSERFPKRCAAWKI